MLQDVANMYLGTSISKLWHDTNTLKSKFLYLPIVIVFEKGVES